VPTATIDADFDASGTYAVNVTTAATAYTALLNAAGATVSDNSGGSLTLTGTGGAQSPNGALSINQGTFVLAGGSLNAGSIAIGASGTFLVKQGQYTGQRRRREATHVGKCESSTYDGFHEFDVLG
jgi:hypothetical protein